MAGLIVKPPAAAHQTARLWRGNAFWSERRYFSNMKIKDLSEWLALAAAQSPQSKLNIPDALLPACIECEETTRHVIDAISHTRLIIRQRDELIEILPRRRESIRCGADDTIDHIAKDLMDKLEITP